MEWSNELILEFLDLYEQEPCIWNPKHPHHKIRNSIHDSWENISKNLSSTFSISELKKKKRFIDGYIQKTFKQSKSKQKNGFGLRGHI